MILALGILLALSGFGNLFLGLCLIAAGRSYRIVMGALEAAAPSAIDNDLRRRALNLCCHEAIEQVRPFDPKLADELLDRRIRINMPGVRVDPGTLRPDPPAKGSMRVEGGMA